MEKKQANSRSGQPSSYNLSGGDWSAIRSSACPAIVRHTPDCTPSPVRAALVPAVCFPVPFSRSMIMPFAALFTVDTPLVGGAAPGHPGRTRLLRRGGLSRVGLQVDSFAVGLRMLPASSLDLCTTGSTKQSECSIPSSCCDHCPTWGNCQADKNLHTAIQGDSLTSSFQIPDLQSLVR